VAIAALAAGKHLLLEKPMGATLADALAIYEKQRTSGKTVMLCHQMRWTWWAQAMKQRCESGALGQVYHARTGWMRRKGIPGWGTWFTQKSISGGGPLIDLGVHMLDVTLYLLDNPIPVSVSGVTQAMFGPQRRGIGKWGTPDWDGKFDVEDFASAFIRLEDGRTLSLDVSWAAHVDRPAEYVDLLGEEAGLSYYGGGLKFLTEREGELLDEVIESPGTNERLEMSREFIAAARAGRQASCDAFSGLVNNAILDAIYRSSDCGAEVAIELPRRA
jgi:predicted dehydrogenase